jgi:hypothetical protein
VGHADNAAHLRLHVLGHWLERDVAGLHDYAARMHKQNAVAVRVYLEFGQTLLRGYLLVLRLISCVLDESVQDVDTWVQESNFLKDYRLAFLQNYIAHWAIIAVNKDFLLVVFWSKNEAWSRNWR